VLRNIEDVLGHHRAPDIGALVTGMDGEMVLARIVFGDHGAGLHRRGGDAVDREGLAEHVGRFRQRVVHRLRVAELGEDSLVSVAAVVKLRRIRRVRRGRGGVGRQRGEFHLDGFRRVLALVNAFRDHHGDGMADMAHAVLGQRRAGRAEHG
jgi:hypothetical protein